MENNSIESLEQTDHEFISDEDINHEENHRLISHDDIEALATYYEVTCDYYEAEFLGLEDYI